MKINYFDHIVVVQIWMRPSSSIATDHVTSMTFLIKFKLKVILLRNLFVAYPHCDPFQIVVIDSKCKTFNIIRKRQSRIHQCHLIHWINVRPHHERINHINFLVMHDVWEFVKLTAPEIIDFLVHTSKSLVLLDQSIQKSFDLFVDHFVNILVRIVKEI